ncbi:MAG: helix-turn-helix transcriptional regulator [Psychrilyobacter sp.]|nr:helix-turn-helix transcriptional regulator [Psychrilyobacter sp.]
MIKYKDNIELFEEKVKLIKSISHPIRLCIVKNLTADGATNVKDMQICLETPQSTISQHLSVLKSAGVIKGKRKGVEVYYSISDEKTKKFIDEIF